MLLLWVEASVIKIKKEHEELIQRACTFDVY